MTNTAEQQAVTVAQDLNLCSCIGDEDDRPLTIKIRPSGAGQICCDECGMPVIDDDPKTWRELAEAAIADLGRYADDELPHRRNVSYTAYWKRFELLDRLASVSSASAEGIEACIALCDRMENDESLPDQAVYAAWNLKVGMLHLLKRASASPEPVPATNKAGEVLQADREFAARWIVIAPQNAKMIRAGDWDHHDGVQAAMRHRLATQPATMQEEAR